MKRCLLERGGSFFQTPVICFKVATLKKGPFPAFVVNVNWSTYQPTLWWDWYEQKTKFTQKLLNTYSVSLKRPVRYLLPKILPGLKVDGASKRILSRCNCGPEWPELRAPWKPHSSRWRGCSLRCGAEESLCPSCSGLSCWSGSQSYRK